MTKLGLFLAYTRTMFLYANGDGVGFVWNWYNPMSWFFALIIFVLAVLTQGIGDTWKYKHHIGFGMCPYFIKNPDKLVWLKPGEDTPKAKRRKEKLRKSGYYDESEIQ